jgi:hypothetical protein
MFDPARSQLEFMLRALRKNGGPLKASMFFEGSPAVARWEISEAPSAWLLWSMLRTVETMPDEERRPFLRQWQREWELAADFLTEWVDPRTGTPIGTPGVTEMRRPREATVYLGIVSALGLAGYAGEAPPEAWNELRASLADQISTILERNEPIGLRSSLLPLLLSGYPVDSAVVLPLVPEWLEQASSPGEITQLYASLVLISKFPGSEDDFNRLLKQTEERVSGSLRAMDTGALATVEWAARLHEIETAR